MAGEKAMKKCPSEYKVLRFLENQTAFVFYKTVASKLRKDEELTSSVINWLIKDGFLAQNSDYIDSNTVSQQCRITPAGRERLRQLRRDMTVNLILIVEALTALAGLLLSVVTFTMAR